MTLFGQQYRKQPQGLGLHAAEATGILWKSDIFLQGSSTSQVAENVATTHRYNRTLFPVTRKRKTSPSGLHPA